MNESLLQSVWVIIPALNEEHSLPYVLRDLPRVGRVIVVDNGSSDRTATVAVEGGATVVPEPQRGYGSACLGGLDEVKRLIDDGAIAPEVIVFVDADYSDHPHLLPRLVLPIFQKDADLVMGSRLLGKREVGAMPPQSVYGNRFACWLMRLLFGAKFTDLGPFRAIEYTKLLQLQMEDRNYGWTIEMQIKALHQRLRWQEIPVPYRRRIGSSKISGTLSGTVKAGSKILATIARYGLSRRATPQRTEESSSSVTSPEQRAVA